MTREPHLVTSEAELRSILGEPNAHAQAKLSRAITAEAAAFIATSTFVLVATGDPSGGLDVSPRGDAAGFVRVLDPRTLLLPERAGSRLADTLTNLLADDRIALLFLTPGVRSGLRANGHAAITDDVELLNPSALEGVTPRLGLLISVAEVYPMSSRALTRSGLI